MSEAWTAEAAAVKPENSPTDFIVPAEGQSDKPATVRLVIRAQILSDEPPPTVSTQGSWNLPAIGLAIGALAVLLLAGIGVFRIYSKAPHPPEKTQPVEVATPAPLPMAGNVAPPVTSVEAVSGSADPESATPGESGVLSPLNKVIPSVSRSSLQTIHGTIKVSIRIAIDKQGAVVTAALHNRGSSRYFERLALDAAKQWTFAPGTTEAKRTALVQFNFSRNGVSADLRTLQ